MRRKAWCVITAAALGISVSAVLHGQKIEEDSGPLHIRPEDTKIEQNMDGGYDLWIKVKEGLGSVLLTESTADPEEERSSFALRNTEYHPVNGDERRMLNGDFLPTKEREHYYLIDSTTEEHPELGEAYRVFIPYVVEFGYPWSREGELQILDGTWINIRTFEQPYASYQGEYKDNPFEIRVVQAPIERIPEESPDEELPEEPPKDIYMADTADTFEEIARDGDGETIYGEGGEDTIDNIREVIRNSESDNIDLVICLDTTNSMENDMDHVKKSLIPMIEEEIEGFDNFRIGMVLYRDYHESYLTRPISFTDTLSSIQRVLNTVVVYGGRDIPEAVHEALYEGVTHFDWEAETRLIILIGDAPPHPKPRGDITMDMVIEEARRREVQIHTIILPH
ncbi:MAG: vWA domain-containing protein [Spirochaetia bacterium]